MSVREIGRKLKPRACPGLSLLSVSVVDVDVDVGRSTSAEEGEDDSVVGRGMEGVAMGGVRRAFWCLVFGLFV